MEGDVQGKSTENAADDGAAHGASGEAGAVPSTGADAAHLFVFTAWKAGTEKMSKRKKEEVNQTIYEMSKNSKYFKRAQENDQRTQEKIAAMRRKIAVTTAQDLQAVRARVDRLVEELEQSRDLSETFCVIGKALRRMALGIFTPGFGIDMDMFFAAVEMRENPSLIGKPIAVGGMSMISTANYEARKFGVRSAMPGFIAKKLCPELIFVRSSFDKYRAASEQIQGIFREYDPDVSATSLDEAYLRLTDFVRRKVEAGEGSSSAVAQKVVAEIRGRVLKETRLTCSAGIGPSRMIAKIASDFNKPNGQYFVASDRKTVLAFLWDLNIRKVPGIGKVTEKLLTDAFHVNTVKELFEQRYLIHHLCTPNLAHYLLRSSLGVQPKIGFFETDQAGRKSISVERTFGEITVKAQMYEKCHTICHNLAKQMKEKDLRGKTITLKLKSTNFEVKNKQVTVQRAIGQDGEQLFEAVLPLLRACQPKSLRLMGVKVSTLVSRDGSEGGSSVDSRTQPSINQFFRKRAQDQSNDMREQVTIECPICGKPFTATQKNEEINAHVDLCLNQGVVANLSSSQHAVAKKKQKRAVTDYFKTS